MKSAAPPPAETVFVVLARHGETKRRRHLIEQGAFVYYVGMVYPFLRELGIYELCWDELKLWEFDERVSRVYHELDRNQFARVTVPTKLFDRKDTAFALVPEGAGLWRSKYAYV